VTPFALAPTLLVALGVAGAPAELPTLSLEDALAELDRQSLTLVQARSRADEADGVVRQAAAALLPTLSAGLGLVRNSDAAQLDLPPALGGRSVVMQPLHSATWSGTLRVPLLVPSSWFDLTAAREVARAAELSADAVRLASRTALAQSAHLAAAGQEQVAASERAVENAAELVRSAGRRLSAGTAAPLEVTRARAEQVRRESDLAAARAGLERARLAVGILLGREGPVRVTVPEVEGRPRPELAAPADQLFAEALEHRPEFQAQAAQQAAAEAGVHSAWARLAPQLSASASVFSSDAPNAAGKKDGWRATVDLTWPLYDGGYRYGKLHQAEAQVAGARAGAEAQRLAVLRDVQDSQRDLAVAEERLRLARAQLGLAGDAAASARRSFEAGVASSLDVLDANDRLYLADTGLAEARARLAQASLALQLALGREAEGS
jgi:outer membrane protein TolC